MSGADLSGLRMSPAFPGNRVTADVVADKLREAIQAGALPDGAVLNQGALAERFGVSTQPVREALRQLMAEGLIETRAHHGSVVRGLPIERLQEVYDNRAVIEGHMLVRAIPRIPAATIAELRAQEAAMPAGADVSTWLVSTRNFHDTLLRFAKNQTGLELVAQLRARAERYVRMWSGFGDVWQPDLAEGEHAAILRAIEDGDGAGARRLLEAHIRDTGRRLVELGRRHAERAPKA